MRLRPQWQSVARRLRAAWASTGARCPGKHRSVENGDSYCTRPFRIRHGVARMSRSVLVELRAIPEGRQRFCSSCGAMGSAGCDHGAPLITRAEAARRGLLAAPEKSNRAIAAAAGVSEPTVRRVRGASYDARERKSVIGKDGKRYKPRRQASPSEDEVHDSLRVDCDGCTTDEERWQRSAANLFGEILSMRAYWKKEFGAWEKFRSSSAIATLAKQSVEELTQIAGHFKGNI